MGVNITKHILSQNVNKGMSYIKKRSIKVNDFKMDYGEQDNGFSTGKNEVVNMTLLKIESFRDSNLAETSFNGNNIPGFDMMTDVEKSFEIGRFNGRRMALMKELRIWDEYVRKNNDEDGI